MARKFNSNGIADGTLPGTKISSGSISASLVGSVRISSISITDNSYVVLDDTAVILTGGYITIIGTGFVSGCSVAIDTTIATSVSFVSATQLNVQVPAKAAGTYNIYLTTPTGAVAIRVNAITYSSTPTWVSTSPLPGGVNNTAISIQLGATSDTTITYTLQAGSTLPTGLTLSSGGLLAGTVTGLALETTYNFTVVATDVELQDSPKAFSITIVVSDQYFKSTVLLLQGDVTPFTADASTNTFELTAVGTPSADVNNPLQPGYYSGSFNGSSDYLSVPNINFSTNAFTIEGWFYPFSLATATNFWGTDNGSGSSPKMLMYINGSAQLTIDFGTAGTTQFPIAASIATYGLNTYQWNHIALVRSDLTATGLKLYINGILAGTGQVGTNLSTITAIFNVGYIGEAYGTKFNGYISNTRVVKGVAVYTGNFTPPTAPLAATQTSGTNIAAITGTATSLLTLQSNRFIDNSPTPQTITAYGTTSISVVQPFTLPAPYTGYGSGLFNGSSYISAPTNATKYQFLNSETYTLEAWVYFTNPASATEGVITTGPVGTMKLYLGKGGGGITNGIDSDGSVGYTVTHYEWIHLAIIASVGVLKLYRNGVLAGSTTFPWNIYGTNFIVGRLYTDLSQYQLNGYVANVRAVKGVAVYTGVFTPPTLAPLTNAGATSAAAYPSTTNVNITFASSATSILTLQNNQAQNNNQFRDSSTNNFAVTRTGTPTQGTFTPFSQTGWSGYLASQQYIYTPANTTFDITAVDFTVECWVYFIAYNGMQFSGGVAVSTYMGGGGWAAGFAGQNGLSGINFSTYNAGATTKTITAASINSANLTLNSWHHVAWVQRGANFYFFLDGVSYNTTTALSAGERGGVGGQLSIGVWAASMTYSGNPNWYLSNMRIVKGVAVYTGNFTPPTAPLTATQSGSGNIAAITGTATSLLTLQNNRFKDNSSNAFSFTSAGTPSIQAFSPFAPTTTYSTSAVGGSGYFNGGTDKLTFPLNTSNQFETGDFTVEFWSYIRSQTGAGLVNNYTTLGSGSFGIFAGHGAANTTKYQVAYSQTGFPNIQSTTSIAYNQWVHIAVVRSGTTITFYINGVVNGTLTGASGALNGSGNWTVGTAGDSPTGYYVNAYISNLRIVKGTAVYTGAFTPPTAPLTAIAGTSVLLNATNSGILDATGKNDLVTVGDARVSTSKQKYGTGAMYFDGTGDYLSLPSNPNLAFGTSNFTIEMWVNLSALSGVDDGVFWEARSSGATSTGFVFNARSSGGGYVLNCYTNSGANLGSTVIAFNTWNHIALVRNGSATGNLKFYIGGLAEAVVITKNNNFSDIPIVTIGQSTLYGSSNITGYIDDLRITKGIARYTTTFTPPSQAMLGM